MYGVNRRKPLSFFRLYFKRFCNTPHWFCTHWSVENTFHQWRTYCSLKRIKYSWFTPYTCTHTQGWKHFQSWTLYCPSFVHTFLALLPLDVYMFAKLGPSVYQGSSCRLVLYIHIAMHAHVHPPINTKQYCITISYNLKKSTGTVVVTVSWLTTQNLQGKVLSNQHLGVPHEVSRDRYCNNWCHWLTS